MLKKVLIIILISLLSPIFSTERVDKGYEAGQISQDYEAGLKFAKENNLPIILSFTGSDWCHWCQLMDKTVFNNQGWEDYITTSMVHISLDFPQEASLVPPEFRKRNNQLQAMYAIRGYPTYIILASDGKTVLGYLGARRGHSSQSFISEVKALL